MGLNRKQKKQVEAARNKLNGLRQLVRQTYFSRVHWNPPATISRVPPNSALVLDPIIDESIAWVCNAQLPMVAPAAKPHQTRTYPNRNTAVGT